MLGFIAFTIGFFSEKLRQKTKELLKISQYLEEAKDTLEIKVKYRTKELKKLTDHLEDEVEKRTKKLQENMKQLEKFSKLTIDRELKMVELKKELEGLKKKLEESKNLK